MRRTCLFLTTIALVLVATGGTCLEVQLVKNGGLEDWTNGIPDHWDLTNRSSVGVVNPSPTYTISRETVDLRPGTQGSSALKCSRPAADYTFPYWAFTNEIDPVSTGTLVDFSGWLKGTNQRAYPAFTEDGGATWVTNNTIPIGGYAGSAGWTNVTGTLTGWDNAARKYKISFHSFSGDGFLDDISLVADVSCCDFLYINLFPDPAILVSRTVLLEGVPDGPHSGNLLVAFDVGNDGSIEATDSLPPYQYFWDTQTTEPGKGEVEVMVRVTDLSTSETAQSINRYQVDNRYAGRVELMTNGDFDHWQTGNPNLPVDWVENQPTSNATYGPDADNPDGLSTPSLLVTFAAFDNMNRYTLRHAGVQNQGGVFEDHQVTFWGKGSACALQYWKSLDGMTWENSGAVAAAANSTVWVYAVGAPQPAIAEAPGGWTTLATVGLIGKSLFDNISWKAVLIPLPGTGLLLR